MSTPEPRTLIDTPNGMAPLAHLPAQFQRQRAKPAPIAFVDSSGAATSTSIKEPSQATRDRWARQARAIEAARTDGFDAGLQDGYMQGSRYGMVVGFVGGLVVACVAWGLWLTMVAPHVAPPSATSSARPLA
jgi:hypothetical protein